MKKIDFGSDEEFIIRYLELKSSRKMGEFYSCDKTSVLNHAKKIGFNPNDIDRGYKLSQADKEKIVEAYDIKTSTQLAIEYNVSRGMITKIWYDNGLTGKKNIKTKTTEIDITGETFGYLTVLNKTEERNASGSVKWLCRCQCGREKIIAGTLLRQGRTISCGLCSNISKGNLEIAKILDQANISYELEKKFSTCKDKRELPFDFYVNNQYLIEYDGEQHFDENSPFDYEYTHSHDLIKNEWCKNNNIPLIRIPYTHFKQLCLNDLLLETSQFIIK